MDTPQLIMYAAAAIGAVVWLCGLVFLLRLRRQEPAPQEFWDDDEGLREKGQGVIRGSAVVSGQPAELSGRAAGQLAQHGLPMLGPVKILEQDENHVVFETMGTLGTRFMQRATLEFHPLENGQTQVAYSAIAPRRQGLLAAAWVVQILGLVVLIGGFIVLSTWVASDPRPGVRWQSVQMVQAVHLLWPPFLLGALYRRTQTHVRNTLDSLITNLPYVQH